MRFSLRPALLSLALFLSACTALPPEPAVCPGAPEVLCPVCPTKQCPILPSLPEPPARQQTAGELGLPIVGAIEWATVEPGDIQMEARIDTGAETTSIHAEDIRLVERDGKRYVRFKLLDPATDKQVDMEERLKRRVLIKQHEGEPERRYVVRLWLTLGETRMRVEVNLSDRDIFEYPLLIGRNFLTDTVIVDVSQHHVLGK